MTTDTVQRKKAFEGSTAFKEAMVVVEHDLRRAASTHAIDVEAFLLWMRENGLAATGSEIREKIKEFDKGIIDSFRLYVGFVLRFQVHLNFVRRKGVVAFVPDFEGPRQSQLRVRMRGGDLIPPQAEPDGDIRDLFASIGGVPEQIRVGIKKKGSLILMSEQVKADDAMLLGSGWSDDEVALLRATQRKRGINPEDAKLRIIEVDSGFASSVTQLLDASYDPLSITFLLVKSREQMRLMCLVGELVSDKEWNQLGVFRAIVQSVVRGNTPAGRPFNSHQFAQDLERIPTDGKITNDAVIKAIDGKGTARDVKRAEKRLQRAKSRLDRVRRQISFC